MIAATKNTLLSAWHFLLYGIAPILIFSLMLGDPFLSAIIDNGYWHLIFAFIAGFFVAVKETFEEGHFENSVFKKLNPFVWQKTKSSGGKKVLNMKVNPWHIAKMLETLFTCLAITYSVSTGHDKWYEYLLIYGFYKWSFGLFYTCLLVSKSEEV